MLVAIVVNCPNKFLNLIRFDQQKIAYYYDFTKLTSSLFLQYYSFSRE